MSDHIYDIEVGGKVDSEKYVKVVDAILAATAGKDFKLSPYGDPNGFTASSHSDGYWHGDDLSQVTALLQELELPYRMYGFCTVSDSNYITVWRPGMQYHEDVETDDSWNEPDDESSIIDIIEEFDAAEFTKENLLQAIRERESKVVIPKIEWADGEVPQPRKFIVSVCRTGYGHTEIEVVATDELAAEDIALDIAGNYSYNEKSSEYSVEGVSEAA